MAGGTHQPCGGRAGAGQSVSVRPQRLPPLAQQQPRQPRDSKQQREFQTKRSDSYLKFQNSVKIISEASTFSEKHACKMMTTSGFSGEEALVVTPTSAPAGRCGQCSQGLTAPPLLQRGSGNRWALSPCPFIQILLPSECRTATMEWWTPTGPRPPGHLPF